MQQARGSVEGSPLLRGHAGVPSLYERVAGELGSDRGGLDYAVWKYRSRRLGQGAEG